MVLRAKESYDPLFIYFILTQEKNIYDLQHIAEVRSGTFPQITYKELSQVKATLPKDRKVVKAFSDIFLKQHFEKSFKLEKNSEVLKKLRDTLLPKLISGELRLPDTHQPEPLSESEGQQQPLAACGG
ncbi:hypothetical protein CI610_01795 [invertebrate metagenome]|uniref:Type I restriction modification DNA specificity domain-containing protein n=1 Tax=invertebrate metagenome TaxID=1711999 RepID=A0A2H9T7W2_9ZZZZ